MGESTLIGLDQSPPKGRLRLRMAHTGVPSTLERGGSSHLIHEQLVTVVRGGEVEKLRGVLAREM